MMHRYYGGAAIAEGHARPPKGGLPRSSTCPVPDVLGGQDRKVERFPYSASKWYAVWRSRRKASGHLRGWIGRTSPSGRLRAGAHASRGA